ncbi:MAG: MBOAT family protein [Alistipes sp.]|nr:MBOAT family protein [Alistipes sp.]
MTISTLWANILEKLAYDPQSPMIFSSGTFWALFLIFMPIYALLKRSRMKMIVYVVAFSLYFYYKSSGVFFLLIVATSIIDYLLSLVLARREKEWQRKLCVLLSVAVSLSVLGYFKYANLLVESWSYLVGSNFQPLDIILPVGISFYTFQSISYIVDVYRRRIEPTDSWLEYIFFLSFFPALVAGPIVRADHFLPQIKDNRIPERSEVWMGFWLILLGVVKKALLADYIAQYNDIIFTTPETYTGFENLMAMLGYTMQIYCDFSGYSDMAIGIAMIMGYRLPQNFNLPYKSLNVTEFWHRWHISLSSWLRDYLYIPLGGNRRGKVRTYFNNLVTMLIGGLWHGASWKFVAWGGFHGVALIVHKMSLPLLNRIPNTRLVKLVSWLLTVSFAIFTMTIFRVNVLGDLWVMLHNVFTNFHLDYLPVFVDVRLTWCIFMLILIISHAMPDGWWQRLGERFAVMPWVVKLLIFVVVVQLVLQFRSEDVAPFIYFQF